MTGHQAVPGAIVGDFAGWVDGDPTAVSSTLSPSCLIIESHGPIYRGRAQAMRWAEDWLGSGSTVDRWDIVSSIGNGDRWSVEWEFVCTVEGKRYAFDGASIITLEGGLIEYLREYRTTQPLFEADL